MSRNEQTTIIILTSDVSKYLNWTVHKVIDYNITSNTVHIVRYVRNYTIEMSWIFFTVWTLWNSMKDKYSSSKTIEVAQPAKYCNDPKKCWIYFHSEWNVESTASASERLNHSSNVLHFYLFLNAILLPKMVQFFKWSIREWEINKIHGTLTLFLIHLKRSVKSQIECWIFE